MPGFVTGSRIARAALALAWLGAAGASAAPPAAGPSTIAARFVCAGGKTIKATFINGRKSRVRLSLSDGRRLVLPQALSASGARYANRDESLVFWNKGDTAFLEEHGRMTFTGCTTAP